MKLKYKMQKAQLDFAHTLVFTFKSSRQACYLCFLGFQDISLAAKESAAAQLKAIKVKYEEAVELRKKAELDIEAFRPVSDIKLATVLGVNVAYTLFLRGRHTW